jgi:RNA polymerase sigma-70 factor (ECF subfamily)
VSETWTITSGPEAIQCGGKVSIPIEELFDLHHQRLFRLALRLGESEESARDAVQETFLRAARRPESLPTEARPAEAWLVKVLVNIVRDSKRRARVRRESAHLAGRDEMEPARHGDRVVARASLERALEALPTKRRACLVMRELEGLEVREIARLLGVTQVTVRWNIAAARKDLARMLAPMEGKS